MSSTTENSIYLLFYFVKIGENYLLPPWFNCRSLQIWKTKCLKCRAIFGVSRWRLNYYWNCENSLLQFEDLFRRQLNWINSLLAHIKEMYWFCMLTLLLFIHFANTQIRIQLFLLFRLFNTKFIYYNQSPIDWQHQLNETN